MITDKISANISVEELKNELIKSYEDVKQKGKKSLLLTYNGTKVIISKQKKGYDVSPNVPGYVFWVIFLVYVIFFFCINNVDFSAINWDNGPGLVGELVGEGLVVSIILYWIFAEIYVKTKKQTIKDFCDSLKQIITQ